MTKEVLSQCRFLPNQLITNYSHFSLKEGLTFLDCFDPNNYNNVLALHEACYEAFSGVYEAFLGVHVPKHWESLSEIELIKNIISGLETLTPFPLENDENIALVYEFGRNLNEYPFKPFMRFENLQILKNKLFDGLKNLKFTMIEEKYIATSNLEALFPSDYKSNTLEQELIKGGLFVLVPEHIKYAIWGLLSDHIRIVLRTTPSKQRKDLLEVFELLRHIAEIFDGGFKFHKSFGYLAENAKDLGFNVRFYIETEVEEKKIDVLQQFCKSAGWGFNERSEGGKKKVKMTARKPNLLGEELELVNSLVKGLSEN